MKTKARKVITSFADVPVTSPFVDVEVPEWGEKNEETGKVEPAVCLLRHISQGERRRFAARGELGILGQMNDREREDELARWRDWFDSGKRETELLKMCYVKEDGSQLFTDEEAHRLMEQVDNHAVFRLIARAEDENLLTVSATEEFRKNA